MTTTSIKEELYEIITTYLPEDHEKREINMEDHLMNDLGINSTHLVDIALDVEDEFDITLDEEDMEQMQTIGAAMTIIQKKLSIGE